MHNAVDGADEHGREQPDEPVDQFHMALQNRRRRGSPRGLISLVRRGVATVWLAAPLPFAGAIVLAALTAACAIAQVVVAAQVLDTLLTGDVRVVRLLPSVLALSGLAVAGIALGAATSQIQRLLGELVVQDTERRILDVTTSVPLDAYETPWFVTTLVRIELNALTKPLEVAQAVVALVASVIATAGLAAVLIGIEPLLLPLLALTAVPVHLVNRRAGRREFAFASEQAGALRERLYLADVLRERETAKEVRAFDLAGLVRDRWEQRYGGYMSALQRLVRLRVGLAVLGSIASGALLVGSLLFLLWRVQSGHVALAQAGAAIVALRMISSRLQGLAGGASTLFESRLFLEDMHEFLDLHPVSTAHRADQPAGPFDLLALQHISFTYPGSDKPALDDVCLQIGRGEIVAVVGENGSGKTTLAKILAGLHEPTGGVMTWDGAGDLEPARIRAEVAVIFQDFARLQLTARENIAVGRPHHAVDEAALHDAAKRAGAAGFVENLPRAYDTVLSKAMPGGVDLSVGQWQRIALARALYRDAGFVVLDEPTSAMDPRAEHELFSRMRDLVRDRTVLLISHRFSSVRDADRIYVMDSGRVVESGDHDHLMSVGGLYAELFTMQASAYLDS